MIVLSALILLPLAVIGVQLALDLDSVLGVLGYSLYKVFFLVPPLIYCRVRGINIFSSILKLRNWHRHLAAASLLGGIAVLVFWGAYYVLGDLLLDKALIVAKIGDQFSVTASTVLLIAPITIFLNSLLEEFFYCGFAFGLLVKRQRWLGYLLPAVAFTFQHMLFIYHWVTPLPLVMAIVGLFIFALVLEQIYAKADSIVAPWLIHVFGDVAMMGIAITMLWK